MTKVEQSSFKPYFIHIGFNSVAIAFITTAFIIAIVKISKVNNVGSQLKSEEQTILKELIQLQKNKGVISTLLFAMFIYGYGLFYVICFMGKDTNDLKRSSYAFYTINILAVLVLLAIAANNMVFARSFVKEPLFNFQNYADRKTYNSILDKLKANHYTSLAFVGIAMIVGFLDLCLSIFYMIVIPSNK
eukprot:GAHX01000149.1.p1 GENE.GAHX01000149.1~~GAHX01000149.1.p1  ORF type:complete len:189 (-),score=25.90 GAHX01000149.1:111-677(-)